MALHFPLFCYSSVNVVTLLLYILSLTWSASVANLSRETGLDIESGKYDSSWAVQLQYSATESDVRFIASTLGRHYRQILPDNYYLLTDENSPDPSDEPNLKITEALGSFPKVLWVEQQMVHENDVRASVNPTDPLWTDQDYLKSEAAGYAISHNVQDVWNQGYTGEGVTVAVVDDGVRGTHEDFDDRYDADVSFEIAKGQSDKEASHGTKCAGVIAAGKDNGRCGVGVAFDSKIAGIRLFDNLSSTDAQEAEAFYKDTVIEKVDIFSNSWGPRDNGHSIRGPGRLASNALEKGTKRGRNGLGSIYLFSAGNGGQFGDSCAFDGYVNNIHTIAVTSVTKDGKFLSHSEACGAIMTALYSEDMVTLSSESNTDCVQDFGRTSAAAAFLSGIVALALEANPKLTWRDVQHLIARSSTWDGVHNDLERVRNANDFTVGEYLGFGVLDALRLVNKAKTWDVNVPEQLMCTLDIISNGDRSIPGLITKKVKQGDLKCPSNKLIGSLEHVQLRVDLTFTNRAYLAVYVKSPSGTNSKFIYPRTWDGLTGRTLYSDLVVTSVHFWGEPVVGEWTVDIMDDMKAGGSVGTGTLFNLTLVFYGTSEKVPGNNQRITVCSSPIKVFRGDDISCLCKVDDDALLANVTWYKNGVKQGDTKVKENTLTLSDVDKTDSGRYKCVAQDDKLDDETSIVVTVNIRITVCSSPIEVKEGKDISCLCKADDEGLPANVTWYKDGVKQGDTKVKENTLKLSDVDKTDSGTYKCVAEVHGLKNEKSIVVTVSAHFPAWLIVVIVLACLIGVALLSVGIYFLCRYLNNSERTGSHEEVKLGGRSPSHPVDKGVMV